MNDDNPPADISWGWLLLGVVLLVLLVPVKHWPMLLALGLFVTLCTISVGFMAVSP
jgi:hypothetical protein